MGRVLWPIPAGLGRVKGGGAILLRDSALRGGSACRRITSSLRDGAKAWVTASARTSGWNRIEPPSFITPKVAAEIGAWLEYLGAERRLSPKTLEAYRRDVLQFLAFLAEHLGGAPSLRSLRR